MCRNYLIMRVYVNVFKFELESLFLFFSTTVGAKRKLVNCIPIAVIISRNICRYTMHTTSRTCTVGTLHKCLY